MTNPDNTEPRRLATPCGDCATYDAHAPDCAIHAAVAAPELPGELGRIQRMLSVPQGRATITISNPRGGHATFKIKTAKSAAHAGRVFVEVPDESAQWGWRSIGEVLDPRQPFTEFRAYRGTSPALAYAVELVLGALYRSTNLDETRGGPYAVQAADTCGACGRELTHPDSIPVGIGPECAAKLGSFHPGYSSKHVATRTRKQAS